MELKRQEKQTELVINWVIAAAISLALIAFL